MKRSSPPQPPDRPSALSATPSPAAKVPTPRQLARRQRSIAIVSELGIPYFPELPVVEDESEIRPRTVDDVAHRCLAVTICAAKGETGDEALVRSLIKDWAAGPHFSPKERAFIQDPHPSQQSLVNYTWQYEAVHVLLWALGYNNGLGPPNEQCPVPKDLESIHERAPARFVHDARLRSASKLLDMADLYYRINWAAVDLRVKGKRSEAVHPGIAFERHRALNWLIRYMDAEWDEVTTDT